MDLRFEELGIPHDVVAIERVFVVHVERWWHRIWHPEMEVEVGVCDLSITTASTPLILPKMATAAMDNSFAPAAEPQVDNGISEGQSYAHF